MPITLPTPADILARLSRHRILAGAPREELQWLVDNGEFVLLERGERLWATGTIDWLVINLTGKYAIYVPGDGEMTRVVEWSAGDVSGLLPYSRLQYAPGEVVIEMTCETFQLHRDRLGELARECPVVTEKLVHVMLDRARHFTSAGLQNEKMASLGRLAAGLAHELNNPSAAAARSAKLLAEALARGDEAAQLIGTADLDEEQRGLLFALRSRPSIPMDTGSFSTLERSDLEEEIADWLEEIGADARCAEPLVEAGVSLDELTRFAAAFPAELVPAAVTWAATGQRARSLAADVERATSRIHDLVAAVKRFTYMDRTSDTRMEPVSVGDAIADTVKLLGSRTRSKSLSVEVAIPADLPRVGAYGGQLNTVWHNLIDNAIDAAPEGGRVEVSARAEDGKVIVTVRDNGAGIPESIRNKVFDMFFTTKEPGKGTGIGLDTALRIVKHHKGTLRFESEPGRTEFRVALPVHEAQG